MPRQAVFAVLTAAVLLAGACSSPTQEQPAPQAASASAKETAPPYKVRFETSKGPFLVEVHPDWAPLGASRFRELIDDKFFDGNRFFRVVPRYVIQFGLAGSPAKTKKWDKPIKDDEVKQTNRTGTLAFATMGPETRTSQIFINLRTNMTLDNQGFTPFARVIEGLEVVEKLYAGYGERPDQEKITKQGNAYLAANFPNLDYIKTARIVE